jgi:hypothetical protein
MGARCLRCQGCEQVIDPVDWIEHLAMEWDMYVMRWRQARARTRGAEERLEEVERLERNARARLKRLNGKLVEAGEEPERRRYGG